MHGNVRINMAKRCAWWEISTVKKVLTLHNLLEWMDTDYQLNSEHSITISMSQLAHSNPKGRGRVRVMGSAILLVRR